ncbi:hypothetical protein Ddye_005956 [Dipteronia dyeriana]|uniref:HAT C-terminal dimerisation domain-containing protein n=1 Tax=Dipteronia dyeriana TaxID=168575 RepID=A0AAD9XI49_9ROSI|nr:hypothetical protein Ddye_005956 [Dipteronia dyeriana]
MGDSDMEQFDILHWWRDHEKHFQILDIIVKQSLTTPVSTVAVEQEFSAGGNILDVMDRFDSVNRKEACSISSSGFDSKDNVCGDEKDGGQAFFNVKKGPMRFTEKSLENNLISFVSGATPRSINLVMWCLIDRNGEIPWGTIPVGRCFVDLIGTL